MRASRERGGGGGGGGGCHRGEASQGRDREGRRVIFAGGGGGCVFTECRGGERFG